MRNNGRIITALSVSFSILLGTMVYQLISPHFASYLNYIITFLSSATLYEIIFRLLRYLFSNVEILLKLLWGKNYLQGYWAYTYKIEDETKYGAWHIEQTFDSVKVTGFGIDNEKYNRRSDVQSVSQLIRRNNDYEIVNQRRDVDDNGNFPDVFYFSKTTLHLHPKNTPIGFMAFPETMTGITIVYGGDKSGIEHKDLKFKKYPKVKSEKEIEDVVIELIKNNSQL